MKKRKKGAIIESTIDIVVSLVLFFGTPLGMYGMLIGTVCSYCYRTVDVIKYSYRNILHKPIREFLILVIPNICCLVVIFIVSYLKWSIQSNSYVEWAVQAIIMCIICTLVYFIVNYLFNKEQFKMLICTLIQRYKSR